MNLPNGRQSPGPPFPDHRCVISAGFGRRWRSELRPHIGAGGALGTIWDRSRHISARRVKLAAARNIRPSAAAAPAGPGNRPGRPERRPLLSVGAAMMYVSLGWRLGPGGAASITPGRPTADAAAPRPLIGGAAGKTAPGAGPAATGPNSIIRHRKAPRARRSYSGSEENVGFGGFWLQKRKVSVFFSATFPPWFLKLRRDDII